MGIFFCVCVRAHCCLTFVHYSLRCVHLAGEMQNTDSTYRTPHSATHHITFRSGAIIRELNSVCLTDSNISIVYKKILRIWGCMHELYWAFWKPSISMCRRCKSTVKWLCAWWKSWTSSKHQEIHLYWIHKRNKLKPHKKGIFLTLFFVLFFFFFRHTLTQYSLSFLHHTLRLILFQSETNGAFITSLIDVKHLPTLIKPH